MVYILYLHISRSLVESFYQAQRLDLAMVDVVIELLQTDTHPPSSNSALVVYGDCTFSVLWPPLPILKALNLTMIRPPKSRTWGDP